MISTLVVLILAAKNPVAWTDRQSWPHPIASAAEFDLASRAELLVFAQALALTGDDLADALGVKHPDLTAATKWRRSREQLLVENFRRASAGCTTGTPLCPEVVPATWEELTAFSTRALDALPPTYASWLEQARAFHRLYVRELLRLAMLSGRVSSEITPVADGEELGESFADRSFLLTFDDGPTGAYGETDAVLKLMRDYHQHAAFFTVGAAVHARRSIKGLYGDQCLASHGMTHDSLVTSPGAAGALAAWNRELSTVTTLKWFRPPYGQRTAAQVEELRRSGLRVMLWNIDSQDWQAPADSTLVSGRVLTLMLLWRHGVVLFHDVHPAARETLPAVFGALQGDGVRWIDCRTL